MTYSLRLSLRAAVLPLLLALLAAPGLTGCDGNTPGPDGDTIYAGVNFTRLFAEPSAAEIQAVRAEWATRNPEAVGVQIEDETTVDGARVIVLSHEMTDANRGGQAFRHYGVVRIPAGLNDAPVLVVNHGGDTGFDLAITLDLLSNYPALDAQTVQVIPAYRSEEITTGVPGLESAYPGEGTASPWDYDVDDAIALTEAALQLFPAETDPERIGTIGFSRGGDVALLMAARDERVDVVTHYFGPTDFFDLSLRPLSLGLLLGDPDALNYPGAPYILTDVLQPLQGPGGAYDAGADYARARLDVVRRSPAFFTGDLPDLQIHHHRLDSVVPVEQAVALDVAVRAVPNDGAYDFNLYETLPAGVTDGHTVSAMPASYADTDEFQGAILFAPAFAGADGF